MPDHAAAHLLTRHTHRKRAAARPYLLNRETSTVAFTYLLNGQPVTGRMPVKSADILLDVDNPPNSRVSAEIDAAGANAGPFYATEAMKSESVLDTAHFPTIRFRSERIEGDVNKSNVTGLLTVRDVTKRIVLEAVLYRQRGTQAGDRTNLSILMSGDIDRRQFGAGGYPAIVGPVIRLQILTRITLA